MCCVRMQRVSSVGVRIVRALLLRCLYGSFLRRPKVSSIGLRVVRVGACHSISLLPFLSQTTGSTVSCNHPVVVELILDSLRHW